MTGAASTSVSTAAARPAALTGMLDWRSATKAAITRRAGRSVDRSAIAGRCRPGCSAWKRRATGLISRAATSACRFPNHQRNQTKIDAFGLFTGQIGYAWDRALFYVKGGAAVTDNKYTSISTGPLVRDRYCERNPLGRCGRRWLRIRHRPELVARLRIRSPVHGQQRRRFQRRLHRRPYQGGRRSLHRPPELQVRRPGGGPLLSQADQARPSSSTSQNPGPLAGVFLLVSRWEIAAALTNGFGFPN